MNPLVLQALGSIVRFGLASLATYLVQKGVWTATDAQTYVGAASAGIVLGIATLAWSFYARYKDQVARRALEALHLSSSSTQPT